jgi:signal transduction histidine kinase
MRRAWVWGQLVIGWLPVWALFAVLMHASHRDTSLPDAALVSLRLIGTAALLGLVVERFCARVPWPHPFRLGFIGVHALGAAAYASAWLILNSVVESALHRQIAIAAGPGVVAFLVTGVWLYVMVVGVSYANRAAQRAAQVEANATRAQLAALRSQLNPHFLFNAMHTVVQLIPADPRGAARAAERLADVLRTTLEERRDQVSLAEEWAFVQRYLDIERIRFGDRLAVHADLEPAALALALPSFALQTLVENAVRHGAAPRVEPTTIAVVARVNGDKLDVRVSDNGSGADPDAATTNGGTGLRRLRERLIVLHGAGARLDLGRRDGGGFEARLVVPARDASAAEAESAA